MATTLGSRPQSTLKVTSGPAAGQSFELSHELVIGRENADLTIADPEVSRRHATLRPAADGVVIEDLGSSNGTFVNGQRISGSITLSKTGALRIGESEMTIDIQRGPQIDTTRARPVIPDHATRLRHSMDEPAAARPVALEPPTARVQAPDPSPAQPAANSPPGAPTLPRPRGPWARVPGLVAVIAALAIGAFVVLSTNGSSTKRYRVTASLTTVLLSETGPNALFAGTVTAQPGGSGSVTIDQVYGGPLSPHGKPIPVSARVIMRFDSGTVDSTLQATAAPQPNGSVNVLGHGTVVGGTGTYKGATGTFAFSGGRAKLQVPIAHFAIRGTFKY